MSELIQKNDNRATIRWKLMASVSAAALIASSMAASEVLAADSDVSRPLIWIELGAQMERASGDGPFTPEFYGSLDPSLSSPNKIQGELPWALGQEAKISLQPQDSDWIFSAGIRYGRAKSKRSAQPQTNAAAHPFVYPSPHFYYSPGGAYQSYKWVCCKTVPGVPAKVGFADTESRHQESHLILDFQAGKDVGIGLFGRDSSSVVSAGVRFAQFTTRSEIDVKARGDVLHYNGFAYAYPAFASGFPQKYNAATKFRAYSLTAGSARSFNGIGPSLSWDASATLAGNSDTSELTLDWGVNVAVLFGKQKTHTHHQSSGQQYYAKYGAYRPHPGRGYLSLYNHPRVDHTRSRNVTVPNIGGMAGLSIKFPDAKISIGYRADYFFGAMDSGWDTRKSANRSFMGPFASISVGLGD
jgi:iron complex outermembrane receptor protein